MSITPKELATRAGISDVFAWQVLNGKRTPSLNVALRIFDATGLQFGILKGVSKRTIDDLRPAKPTPSEQRAA